MKNYTFDWTEFKGSLQMDEQIVPTIGITFTSICQKKEL